MKRMKAVAGVALLLCGALSATGNAQQVPAQAPAARPPVAQGPPASRPVVPPSEAPRGQQAAQTRRSGGALQGFSVVLVIGELQGTSATDDVPVAARKALTDMREFLPYKTYRLLDAGWLMCCGDGSWGTGPERRPTETSTLALRGPDDHEYELNLRAGRAENARVFVHFNLIASGASYTTAPAAAAISRTLQRRIADLEDKSGLLRKQIADAKSRVEIGMSSGNEIAKLELDLRTAQREITDLRERLEAGGVAKSGGGTRGSNERQTRSAVIDTTFTMDVGETVVVGASRPKGATKALIALVTAVPRGGATITRD